MATTAEKYIVLTNSNHPNSNSQGKIREHVYVVSQALGRSVPPNTHVHHVDYNPKNNQNTNLVLCTPQYHKLLHARTDAFNATGDANKMKCAYCHTYDDPSNMYICPNAYQGWHLECRNAARRVPNPKTGPYKYGDSQ